MGQCRYAFRSRHSHGEAAAGARAFSFKLCPVHLRLARVGAPRLPDRREPICERMPPVARQRGALRIIVPGIERIIRAYVADDARFFTVQASMHPPECTTKLEHLMYALQQHGEHKYGYDFETMSKLLRARRVRTDRSERLQCERIRRAPHRLSPPHRRQRQLSLAVRRRHQVDAVQLASAVAAAVLNFTIRSAGTSFTARRMPRGTITRSSRYTKGW